MIATQRIPWLRIGAESIAIVGSILLAFAIDAWWDARSARRSEHDLLSTLAAELAAAQSALERQLEIYSVLKDATQTIADQLAAAGDGRSVSVQTSYLGALLYNMSFDPPKGATSMLLGSDQVSLIRSDELRAALAEWPAIVEDAVEEQTALWRISDATFEPLLHEAVPNMAPAYEARTKWEALRSVDLSAIDGETTLVSTQVLWNMTYQRLTYLRGADSELRAAAEYLQHLIELTETSLSM